MMSTPKDAIIKIDSTPVELKTVKDGSKEDDPDNLHTISLDATDAGCQSCAPVIRSDSLLSSTDNEIDPAISLNMKKSNIVYKGMMDIALLTANANQLRFLITYNSEEKTFYVSVTLIVLSLIIQVAVGIGLIYKRYTKKKGDRGKADKVASIVICGIFCLAVINVLVASFTTTTTVITAPEKHQQNR